MKNIKVLMFGWELPPHHSGGLGAACYGLSRALVAKNVSLTFVLPKRINGLDHRMLRIVFANVRNIKFRSVKTIIHPYITADLYDEYLRTASEADLYGLNLFDEVRRYGLQARLIAEEEPHDIIHAHDWLSFRAGIEAKRVSGKPLIVHVHATEFDRTGGHPNQYIYEEERRGLHAADCIIAVSHRTKSTIIEHYDISPDKISVVHNGFEQEEFKKSLPTILDNVKAQGKKIVLFFGRITIQKGPDYFLEAARKVLEFDKNVLFIMCGSGDMQKSMIRRCADLGITNNVLIIDSLWGDDRIKLYRAADLYVMPSISEPFGINALESLAIGTPLLVSKQTGATEVITHALRADFWDIDDMTDKIINVLHSGGLSQTLSEFGKMDAERATWDSAAGKCVQIYDNICS